MNRRLLFLAPFICTAQAFSIIKLVPGEYATIQAALTAAVSGDTVQIAAGTFTEKNLTLGGVKSVTIKGAGIGQTIIQAYATSNNTPAASCSVFNLDGAYSSAITITLQDMTIQNGYNSSNGGGIRFTNTGTVAPTLNFTNLKIASNNGLAGGGGGRGLGNQSRTRIGGNGGNGINILTGAVTTGGIGGSGIDDGRGGGGAGVAGNGNSGAIAVGGGIGGLGGGGGGSFGATGGGGILYLFY
jgi:hypothetical protein